MLKVLEEGRRPGESEDDTKRLAHAAVVLLQLDPLDVRIQADRIIWPMLGQHSDPRVRSYLIHRLSRVGLNPQILIEQYGREQDDWARRALLLSLGEIPASRLPAQQAQDFVEKLLRTYQKDPDPGIHSAIDWLLRSWGQAKRLKIDDEKLAGHEPGVCRWFVTKHQGHTLAMINYSFALATKEVTVRQFQEFLKSNPNAAPRWKALLDKADPDEPIVGVTWFEAAQYCRWLSEIEDVPEQQKCYPPIDQIKEGMTLQADHLKRTGYRLPTEAEWENACRAGANTSRHYGVAEELLRDYAWYADNSKGRICPVGSKKPNDFGLFDMLGNAGEWCQRAPPVPSSGDGFLRGGTYASGAADVRSVAREPFPMQYRTSLAGLRVARTCR
jgi:hypothetical protein